MIIAEVFAPHDAAVVITGIIGLMTMVYKFVPQRKNSEGSFKRLEESFNDLRLEFVEVRFKSNQCWNHIFRQIAGNVVMGGLGSSNSPLQIAPDAMNWFAYMKTDLQNWYAEALKLPTLSERDLLIKLDNDFGSRILSEISMTRKRPYPSCLFVAFAVARGDRIIDLPCLSSPENPPETKSN